MLVATPGRFYDLAVTGAVKLKSIKKLVIDEVDEMLNLGFRVQLTNIIDLIPKKRQNKRNNVNEKEKENGMKGTKRRGRIEDNKSGFSF